MAENPLIAGLQISTRFTCPAAVEAYTLAKVTGDMTLALVETTDDDSDVIGAFMTARRAGDNQGVGFVGRTGLVVPLLSDGEDALAAGDKVSVSPEINGYVGLSAADTFVGTVVTGAPAAVGAVVQVLF
jgi:hypothetical protein